MTQDKTILTAGLHWQNVALVEMPAGAITGSYLSVSGKRGYKQVLSYNS